MENQPGQKMLGVFAMGNHRIQKAIGLFAMGNHRIQNAIGLFAMGNHRIQKALGLFAIGNHRSQMLGLFAIVFLMQFGTSFSECDADQWECVFRATGYGYAKCIEKKDRCDGWTDCVEDPKEEKGCQNFTCVGDMVKCGGSRGYCMKRKDLKYRCDGEKTHVCGNVNEEEENCETYVCRLPMIQCPNNRTDKQHTKKCVEAVRRCGREWIQHPEFHCDSTDHIKLYCKVNGTETCASPWIKCPSGKSWSCMIKEWRCDGYEACADLSDEDECAACNLPDDFKCAGGKNKTGTGRTCIHKDLKCDGVEHCEDASDEKGCVKNDPKENPDNKSQAGKINGHVVSIASAMATILILIF